jgi:glycosyl transferase family 25
MHTESAASNRASTARATVGVRSEGVPFGTDPSVQSDMNISRFFPRTICVNLDRRPDRWRRVRARFERAGIGPVERFAAVDGERVGVPDVWEGREGVYGCLRSHVEVVAAARLDGLDSLLVFEDDVEFADDLGPRFARAFAQVPDDWNILYLGGTHRVPPSPVGDSVARVSRTLSTYAYAIHARAFESLIEIGNSRPEGIDLHLVRLQARLACYCVFPHAAWVEVDHSDIQGFEDNHWYLRESVVVGDRCPDDLVGSVALVVPAWTAAWSHDGQSWLDFLTAHLEAVLPGLLVVIDDGPGSDDPARIAARVSETLDGRIEYILVASSPVFLAQRHFLAAFEMCRAYDIVIPFQESVALTLEAVDQVYAGRARWLDPARFPRSPLGGRELGWGLFARGSLGGRPSGQLPSVFEVPLVGFRLDAPGSRQAAVSSAGAREANP